MSSKRWLVMLPVAILLAAVCCGVFNILIDPFGVFGDPILDWYSYDETNNPRVAKLAWLEEHHDEYRNGPNSLRHSHPHNERQHDERGKKHYGCAHQGADGDFG